jgi:hypothetical protein
MKVLLVLVLIQTLTGCAALMIAPPYDPVGDSRASLSAKTAAAKSLREFNYIQLDISKQQAVRVDKDDQAFDFSEGKSFYEAYMFSTSLAAAKLTAKAWHDRHGEWKVDDIFVLYPEFMFLDENWEVIGSTISTPYVQQSNFIRGRYIEITREMSFPRPAKYMILKTSDRYVGRAIERMATVGGSQYSPPENIAVSIPFNYEGAVEFTIEPISETYSGQLKPITLAITEESKTPNINSILSPSHSSADAAEAENRCRSKLSDADYPKFYRAARELREDGYKTEALTCFIALLNLGNVSEADRKQINITIGIMYEIGDGVEPDKEKAMKYYKDAEFIDP